MPTVTFQIGASADDCFVYFEAGVWNGVFPADTGFVAGDAGGGSTRYGSGGRFLVAAIPPGSVITSAFLRLRARDASAGADCLSRITGELSVYPAAWTTLANYQSRRGTAVGGANDNNRTVAQVSWDNIAAWVLGNDYDSPDISAVIQEIVNQGSWFTGANLALWWDDHEARSVHAAGNYRAARAWDSSPTFAPRLIVTWTNPPNTPPYVTTQAASAIVWNGATGNGTVHNRGTPDATAHGVCWNTTGDPTIADARTDNGAVLAEGAFTGAMTDLFPNTTYFVRAYATNPGGTSYSAQVSFTTPATATIGLLPRAAGDRQEWNLLVGAATQWQACLTNDGDTSYSGAGWPLDNLLSLFNFDSLPGNASAIGAVQVDVNMRRNNANLGLYAFWVKTGGVEYQGPAGIRFFADVVYVGAADSWATNPNTGLAWTLAEVNALQAGVLLGTNFWATRVTNIVITLTYTPRVSSAQTNPATEVT